MLVLTRKESEKIMIGEDIELTVLQIEGGQVQIGLDAPQDIVILREEIINEVKKENVQSTQIKTEQFKEFLDMMKQGEKGSDNEGNKS